MVSGRTYFNVTSFFIGECIEDINTFFNEIIFLLHQLIQFNSLKFSKKNIYLMFKNH